MTKKGEAKDHDPQPRDPKTQPRDPKTQPRAPKTHVSYTCGKGISSDCRSEEGNARRNNQMQNFCGRCATEGGAQPLRSRCKLCCDKCGSKASLATLTRESATPGYVVNSGKSPCANEYKITTSADCRAAAQALRLRWDGDRRWNDRYKGCSRDTYGTHVNFNS